MAQPNCYQQIEHRGLQIRNTWIETHWSIHGLLWLINLAFFTDVSDAFKNSKVKTRYNSYPCKWESQTIKCAYVRLLSWSLFDRLSLYIAHSSSSAFLCCSSTDFASVSSRLIDVISCRFSCKKIDLKVKQNAGPPNSNKLTENQIKYCTFYKL